MTLVAILFILELKSVSQTFYIFLHLVYFQKIINKILKFSSAKCVEIWVLG